MRTDWKFAASSSPDDFNSMPAERLCDAIWNAIDDDDLRAGDFVNVCRCADWDFSNLIPSLDDIRSDVPLSDWNDGWLMIRPGQKESFQRHMLKALHAWLAENGETPEFFHGASSRELTISPGMMRRYFVERRGMSESEAAEMVVADPI